MVRGYLEKGGVAACLQRDSRSGAELLRLGVEQQKTYKTSPLVGSCPAKDPPMLKLIEEKTQSRIKSDSESLY